MDKRPYKHVRTGAVQMLDEKTAAGFPDWKPTTDTPPCKDDYRNDFAEEVPFSADIETGFVRLDTPFDITAETSDKEAAKQPAHYKKRKKDLED